MLGAEIARIQEQWLAERRTRVFGIPLFIGADDRGQPFIQRLAFTSVFSDQIRAFVHDPRFAPILDWSAPTRASATARRTASSSTAT
jgi:hypothetical protein